MARGILPLLIIGSTFATGAWSFSNYSPGEVLPERTLTPLSGGKKLPWLGKAKVNVFFFFTPGSKHSKIGVKELAGLEKEFAGKPVTFVGLVSGNVQPADAKKDLDELGFASPVLVDEGDAIYGMLGTALTPVVGITDEKHKLLVYLPFNKLQYQDKIRAWIQHGLGEINEEQLKVALAPPAATEGGDVNRAHRYLKLGERQEKAGNLDSALTAAKKSLELGESAGAHALLGRLLAAKGSCEEAASELQRALALEPDNEQAKSPLPGCGAAGGKALSSARVTADAGAGSSPGSSPGGTADAGPADGETRSPDGPADGGTRSSPARIADGGTRSSPARIADGGTRSSPARIADGGTRSVPRAKPDGGRSSPGGRADGGT